MDKKYIVALELSGTRVNGVLASVPAVDADPMELPVIEAIVSEDDTESVQYGRVQNLINAHKSTSAVVREMSHQPEIADGKITGCYVALAGRSMGSERVTAEIELAAEMEINHDILKKLYQEACHRATYSKRVLQVLPRKFYVDNQAVSDPIGSLGRRLKGDFTLVLCDPNNQRKLDYVFADKMHMDVYKYIETPVALAEMVLGEEEKQVGCMLVDMGASTTTIAIYKDRSLQYLATLPMGSKFITRDISVGLNITHEKAEAAKIEYGDATAAESAASDDVSRINNYVSARAFEIVMNIMANIGYAGYEPHQLPGGFIISGRGSYLKNFDKLLNRESKLPVRSAALPAALKFAFNFGSVHPVDYLSIIAMVLRIARKEDFKDCVKFGEDPAPEEIQIVSEPKPATPKEEEKEFKPIPVDPEEEDPDDDDWSKDDPDPRNSAAEGLDSRGRNKKDAKDKKKGKEKKGSSWVEVWGKRLTELLSTQEIGDENLDNN